MANDVTAGEAESKDDFGLSPRNVVRRWNKELSLASDDESDWRKECRHILKLYRSESKGNDFNIFWSNTETLRPAIYNSAPVPDVRRRFSDKDPLGKCVSEVLNRALTFSIDCDEFDTHIKYDVLDMLLFGRGISRIRYVPTLVPGDDKSEGKDKEPHDVELQESEGSEELSWEQCVPEHVSWDDFRHGPGRTWNEVQWVAFKHNLTRDELVEKFGDVGGKIPLTQSDDDKKLDKNDPVNQLFKTAEVWEIWDKEQRKVLFISTNYADGVLGEQDDPLKLEQFFPVPRPVYAIEDSSSLVPVPLYSQYKKQIDELNRIQKNISTVEKTIKVRGIYDSTLGELKTLYSGEGNELIPAENVSKLLDRGGLEKAIFFAPIEVCAGVLKVLYEQRDKCIQVIYQVTGISDIQRGETEANETAAAQKIKTQWGTLRLQRLQGEVQRYIRDLIRLMAEIIGERFQPDTLKQMTNLNYPTDQQLQQQFQQQMMQYQQAMQQFQQQGQQGGQPPQPPQMPDTPTWEQIDKVLKNDAVRSYKIDIETDSTIAATIQEDVQETKLIMDGVTGFLQSFGPLVQQGMLPFNVGKEILITFLRSTKMGSRLEDALDEMHEPQPQPDPKVAQIQAQAQADIQRDQQKHQADIQRTQIEAQINAQVAQQTESIRAQADTQIEAARMQADMAIEHNKAQLAAAQEQMKIHFDAQVQAMKQAQADQTQMILARLDRMTKLEVAEIAANTTLQAAQMSAAKAGSDNANV